MMDQGMRHAFMKPPELIQALDENGLYRAAFGTYPRRKNRAGVVRQGDPEIPGLRKLFSMENLIRPRLVHGTPQLHSVPNGVEPRDALNGRFDVLGRPSVYRLDRVHHFQPRQLFQDQNRSRMIRSSTVKPRSESTETSIILLVDREFASITPGQAQTIGETLVGAAESGTAQCC